MSRSVVITGLGVVSGLGTGVDALWEGLVDGRSSLGPIERFDARGFRSRLAGEVTGFSARDYVPRSYRKAVKVMARDIQLAVGAASLAVRDADLRTRVDDGETPTYEGSRLGCQIGAGLIAAEADELSMALATAVDEQSGRFSLRAWGESGMNNLQPLWLLKYLPNMLSCHVTILHGATGPSNTITCAEASGLLSMGESLRVIQRGDADACFSGGAESKINLMGLLRLDLAGRLAATGEEEEGWRFVRPYDPDAPGQLIGEAGAIAILESGESARARGARVYAEVVGFGAGHSSPPSIPPLPEPEADAVEDGLVVAIESALREAGIGAEAIDVIVPHAASIRAVDAREAGALRSVFGSRLARIPIVTTVPNVGESMAGQGGILAAAGAKCLHEQRLPARLHDGRSPGLDAGPTPSREATLGYALVCTGSLGGQNAALVLRAPGREGNDPGR